MVEIDGSAGEDDPVFGFASIWDRSFVEEGTGIESCALITVPGNQLMRVIHNAGANPYRMPAILAPHDFEAWLAGGPAEAKALPKPYPQKLMTAYPISSRVNSPKNNGPALIEPVLDQRAAGQSQLPSLGPRFGLRPLRLRPERLERGDAFFERWMTHEQAR